jgi:alpha-mannosidase
MGLAAGTVTPFKVEGTPVVLSGLKQAEEGEGIVLRLYEPAGRRGGLEISLPAGWALSEPLGILEEPLERTGPQEIMPFEVRTWKLKRA